MMRARWTIYALLFSVAVNIAAVAVVIYLWTAGPRRGVGKGFSRPPREPWTELGLTPGQKAQFDSMRQEYFRSLHPLRERLREERAALARAVLEEGADSLAVAERVQKISQIQAEMELRTLRFFGELRKVLTPEQAARFQKTIEDIVRRREPRVRGRREPPFPEPREERREHPLPDMPKPQGGGLNEKSRGNWDDARFAADDYVGLCAAGSFL
ncbi:MAG: Spy/CpxP family protein refolding chaperone [candidate division KSB1 bacterium]|nr:Spy/CpxP family protein refolding chaperone [candidate division KSB1 bacterium]